MTDVQLISPEPDAIISQQMPEQKHFDTCSFSSDDAASLDWLNLIRSEAPDHTSPKPIACRWEGVLRQPVVECAEDPEFHTGKLTFAAEPDRTSAFLHSLKINTHYYWRICGYDSDGKTVISGTRSFYTADEPPRWIRTEGVSNVRDCGGWHTKYGKTVRQGCLYRGGEMDRHMIITQAGKDFLEKQLRLRSVLDMRCEEERAGHPNHGRNLAPSVQWFNIPMRPYWEIFSDVQKSYYAQAFRLLKKENFPLYFHCWGGADRTGTFTLLLNAVLGVEDELLLHDYELTTLAIWGERFRTKDYFQHFLTDFEPLAPNSDFETKALAYFRQCGITLKEIDAFKDLMLF